MHYSRILIPILVLATFSACSDLFNKGNKGPDLTMQTSQTKSANTTFNGDTLVFKKLGYGKDPQKFPSFTSQIKNLQIVIDGYYMAASGFTPAGELNKNGNNITIIVHRDKRDQTSPSAPLGYFYHAYLSHLSKGKYNVKIVHKDDYLRTIQENHMDTVFTKDFLIK